jgi:hypothetical protein
MNSIKINKNEYLDNLQNICEYIANIEEQKILLKEINKNNYKFEKIDICNMNKRFREVLNTPVTYNAIIISLYGCYESYIDKVSNSLLDFWISMVKNYNDLSDSIRNKHIKQSGEFLAHPQRFRNLEITEQDVIRNLNSCLQNKEKFLLNKELLLMHSGNLSIDHLLELFKDLGLKNSKEQILANKKYVKFISDKYELNIDSAESFINEKNRENSKILFEELVKLVEQRNRVAHGWCVDNRWSFNIINEKIIPFMKMFGDVIADIFEEKFVRILSETNRLKKFNKVINIYNNRILCVNCEDAKLKCNGFIYAYNEKGYILLNILQLQYNNKNIEENVEKNIDIGILVDCNIKKNWKFYYT